MANKSFNPTEKHQSQIPAIQLLVNLGFEPLSQQQVQQLRGNKLNQVILEDILEERLLKINHFTVKGQSYLFNIEDAQALMLALKPSPDRLKSLMRTNQDIYDLLILGTSVRKTINGDTKSYTMRYVDWDHPENNRYHVCAEFSVLCADGKKTRRCDIVCFINGIPFIVIENKSPLIPLKKADNQLIRYQSEENIPYLFHYVQLLLTMNRTEAKYAVVGASAKYWHPWRDKEDQAVDISKKINHPLNEKQKKAVFSGDFQKALAYFNQMEQADSRLVTAQDRLIYALCRPSRLLDLIRRFTVFDHGDRKIARYQQYFGIQKTLERVSQLDTDVTNPSTYEIDTRHEQPSTYEIDTRHEQLKVAEPSAKYDVYENNDLNSCSLIGTENKLCENNETYRRKGGVIWHTQGSGKSLTMVMLARALALDPHIKNPRIILVSDRKGLDKQIKATFKSCEMQPVQATSGNNLIKLIINHRPLITTVINKFKTASRQQPSTDYDANLFVLVDESHRTQSGKYGGHGTFALAMRHFLPNACYIGFTGTPLMKREKNTFDQFGGLIHQYTIADAVADAIVVPLLYEGRLVEQHLSGHVIDQWFDHISDGLNDEQKTDLKHKFTRLSKVNNTVQTLQAKAFDISEHFRRYWQKTGFKAQLVVPSKIAAITFKEILDDIGHVTSEVIISPPDDHEGNEAVDVDSKDKVQHFWRQMMKRYDSEDQYNHQIVERFKDDGDPEVLIVVNKLLTGFDAPRNTILYLCRPLKEHNLLQAIARVNRLFEEHGKTKEFGLIIDYEGLLGELDEALTTYSSLEGYDETDLIGAVHDVRDQMRLLPQYHDQLWDVFKSVKNKQDMENLEQYLSDKQIRENFYEHLKTFGRTMHMALSSEKASTVFTDKQIQLFRMDLKKFSALKRSVQIRYQEIVDSKSFEPKIQKLLDNHVIAEPARQIIEQVNINDPDALQSVVEEQGVSQASKADRIASATKRTLTESMALDPAFYRRFSELLEETISEYRARRLSEMAYLKQVIDIANKVVNKEHGSNIPKSISNNNDAIAFYGVLLPQLIPLSSKKEVEENVAKIAVHLIEIIKRSHIINIWDDKNPAKSEVINKMDDYFFDVVRDQMRFKINLDNLDIIQNEIINVAKARFPG